MSRKYTAAVPNWEDKKFNYFMLQAHDNALEALESVGLESEELETERERLVRKLQEEEA